MRHDYRSEALAGLLVLLAGCFPRPPQVTASVAQESTVAATSAEKVLQNLDRVRTVTKRNGTRIVTKTKVTTDLAAKTEVAATGDSKATTASLPGSSPWRIAFLSFAIGALCSLIMMIGLWLWKNRKLGALLR